jgi:hypothetical protein
MFDTEDLNNPSATSLQNYNGVGVEDCQVEPVDYIAGVNPYSYDGSDADSLADKDLALVKIGESPTTIAANELAQLISDRSVILDDYVDSLTSNLADNLLQDGLLGQQAATSIEDVCRIMNHEVGNRDDLQLSDDDARDNFFGNYMNQIQTGSVESSDAARRLASEPCSLCD